MDKKINAIIVDDEDLARESLKEALEKFDDIKIIKECANGFEAVQAVHRLKPDLLFLDIQMPNLDGFDVVELLGKETGYCKGRGGSMHIAAFETGSLGALAIVGAGIPIAVGAALAFKMRGEDRVAVAFTGDGGTNTGNFHEGLNMASTWDLPMILVVENNQYAVSTNIRESVNIEDLSIRARSYDIPGVRVDGFDPLAVYQATTEAVERARRGEGPTLLVTEAYRFEGHYAGEPQVYRERTEVREYLKKDPIPRFRRYLIEEETASQGELDAIDTEVKQEIADAITYAKESPEPDPSTALDYNYA